MAREGNEEPPIDRCVVREGVVKRPDQVRHGGNNFKENTGKKICVGLVRVSYRKSSHIWSRL